METNAYTLQALLYAHGGEMKKSEVAALLDISLEKVSETAQDLTSILNGQGIELVETEQALSLRTANVYADKIAEIQQKDSEKDIGTAGLEVLAIVLYKGEVSRASIDYIRGVNSSGTLRQLVLRGLLERTRDAHDARAWVYTATPELLAHIGIASREDLPEYAELTQALQDRATSLNNEQNYDE